MSDRARCFCLPKGKEKIWEDLHVVHDVCMKRSEGRHHVRSQCRWGEMAQRREAIAPHRSRISAVTSLKLMIFSEARVLAIPSGFGRSRICRNCGYTLLATGFYFLCLIYK